MVNLFSALARKYDLSRPTVHRTLERMAPYPLASRYFVVQNSINPCLISIHFTVLF